MLEQRSFPNSKSNWNMILLCICMSVLNFVNVFGGEPPSGNKNNQLTMKMPNVTTTSADSYNCIAVSLQSVSNGPIYVTGFRPDASAAKAHHMLLHKCNAPYQAEEGKSWDCLAAPTCNDQAQIMYGWAKNADNLELPDGVSFTLDPNEVHYLVLQVHYAEAIEQPDSSGLTLELAPTPTRYNAGIFLLLRSYLNIPHGHSKVHGDVNCIVPKTIHPFAFRTHAHQWGTVIRGYKYSTQSQEMEEIAAGNPQWPQQFYPIKKDVTVNHGEYLVARCTFNNSVGDRDIHIGATHKDEMCNLYLMYYMDEGQATFEECMDEQSKLISQKIPSNSDLPLPSNRDLEMKATGPGHHIKNHISQLVEDGDENHHIKGHILPSAPSSSGGQDITLNMPGALPKQEDSYLCSAFRVKDWMNEVPVYITKFKVETTAQKVHHLIIQGCSQPFRQPGEIWNCMHHSTCQGKSKIMYAWAKDAPPAELPDEVGFKVGEDYPYLVFQVHYAHPLDTPDSAGVTLSLTKYKPTYYGGIYLLWSMGTKLHPHQPKIHADINCKLSGNPSPMTLFAFRTHAHKHGTVITGYKVDKDGKIQEIARGDPQKPQMFYPMQKFVVVDNGDVLHARCTFNTTEEDRIVNIGPTAGDEMCNLYLMYFTRSDHDDFKTCGLQDREITKMLPEDSDRLIPDLMKESFIPYDNGNPHEQTSKKEKKQFPFGSGSQSGIPDSGLKTVQNWLKPETSSKFGQLSSVAFDVYGNVVVFHRGDRTWNGFTFDRNDVYQLDRNNPIKQNTILTLDGNGGIQNEWGSNLFFMPHHLTIDAQNNVWVTDVALHQVFKFPPYGGTGKTKTPVIRLGEKFVPGDDNLHYCKPTSVAVSKDGKTFFVADGYCNHRIIKYSVEINNLGYNNVTLKKLMSWGKVNKHNTLMQLSPYMLNVPHALAMAHDKNLICVADRENGRVLCYNMDGKIVRVMQPPEFGSTIYSVAYCEQKGGHIYAIGGPENILSGKTTKGYILDINDGQLVSTFNGDGSGFQRPHDVAVSPNGTEVYVVELDKQLGKPYTLWRLAYGNVPTNKNAASKSLAEQINRQDATSTTADHAKKIATKVVNSLGQYVPSSNLGVIIAITSLCFTLLITCCVACSRCRKRGKGKVVKNKKDKKLDLGDFLGRSKDGFQPLNTEEDADALSSESDVEDFAVPGLRA